MKQEEFTDKDRIGYLAGAVLFVIEGLRRKTVKSKPIVNFREGDDEEPMITLEEHLWKALNKCGFHEKK